jgi:hypothetical protein
VTSRKNYTFFFQNMYLFYKLPNQAFFLCILKIIFVPCGYATLF